MTTTTLRCCLSPDERHAAYCITRSRAVTQTLDGAGMFGGWSDEQVIEAMHLQADACVAVVNMPAEERHRIGPKGEASPEQAGVLNAVIVLHLHREAQRRGLVTQTLA